MNVLFVFNIGFDRGGASVHLLTDVIEQTLLRGHSCHVVAKKTTDSKNNGFEELIKKHGDKLTLSLIEDVSEKKLSFVKRYFADCKYAVKNKKYYKKGKYDVAFVQSCNVAWLYMGYFRRKKCPTVFNVQDIFPQNLKFSSQLPASKITYPVFCFLQNLAYKKSSKIITISDDMKQTLVEQKISADKIDVVFNWSYGDEDISIDNIPEDRVFDLKTDKNKTNVVYAGNIGKMQNVEIVAETAKLFKDDTSIHYYIIGDGANKHKIENIVEGLQNVTILPMQPSIYAESIYAQADINLIPLAKGGIKTALPSKTATVLRTNKPIIFCIDPDSQFEKTISESPNVKVADNSDPASLYMTICEVRASSTESDNLTDMDVRSMFSKNNASKYVDIMESASHK